MQELITMKETKPEEVDGGFVMLDETRKIMMINDNSTSLEIPRVEEARNRTERYSGRCFPNMKFGYFSQSLPVLSSADTHEETFSADRKNRIHLCTARDFYRDTLPFFSSHQRSADR